MISFGTVEDVRNSHFRLASLDLFYQLSTSDASTIVNSVRVCAFMCAKHGCCVSLSFDKKTGECILSTSYPMALNRARDSSLKLYHVSGTHFSNLIVISSYFHQQLLNINPYSTATNNIGQ